VLGANADAEVDVDDGHLSIDVEKDVEAVGRGGAIDGEVALGGGQEGDKEGEGSESEHWGTCYRTGAHVRRPAKAHRSRRHPERDRSNCRNPQIANLPRRSQEVPSGNYHHRSGRKTRHSEIE
jgi:hypothetical protein